MKAQVWVLREPTEPARGLGQLTRWLATTLAPDIRVNAISPGGIFRNQPEAFVQRYANKTPLARMATEEDRGLWHIFLVI